MKLQIEALKSALKDIDRRYVGHCFAFNIRILVYFGGWPLESNEKYIALRYARVLKYLCALGGAIAITLFFVGIFARWGDIETNAESLVIIIVLETAMVKLYVVIFKMNGVLDLVRILENEVEKSLAENEEMRIFQSYRRAGNVFTFWYTLFCFCAGVSYGIMPFFREGRRLPGDFWCGFDCTISPIYEIFYILDWIVCIALGLVNGIFDSLCMSMLIYTIAQFRILQYRMENTNGYALKKVACKKERRGTILKIRGPRVYRSTALCKETVVDIHEQDLHGHVSVLKPKRSVIEVQKRRKRRCDNNSENVNLRKIEERNDKQELDREINLHLVECIQKQQMLFRFSELLQKNFGQMFFSELLFAGLAICLLLFLIATFKSDLGKLVEWGSILIVAVVQLFAFCWFSSELAHQSTLLNDALYYSDWVSSPPEFKRMMRTVMSRALHPVQLSAGGFLPFSVMQFQAVMQSAYSYYATLTEFNEKQ